MGVTLLPEGPVYFPQLFQFIQFDPIWIYQFYKESKVKTQFPKFLETIIMISLIQMLERPSQRWHL